jgi:adenylosuccinate lyase
VTRGLVVYPKVIESAVNAELPFMATEEILMAGVRAGGDRQELHEAIRRHSHAAAEQVKSHGRPNDLIARLSNDAYFPKVDMKGVLDANRFIGRAPEQVTQFIEQIVAPIRQRYAAHLGMQAQLRI